MRTYLLMLTICLLGCTDNTVSPVHAETEEADGWGFVESVPDSIKENFDEESIVYGYEKGFEDGKSSADRSEEIDKLNERISGLNDREIEFQDEIAELKEQVQTLNQAKDEMKKVLEKYE